MSWSMILSLVMPEAWALKVAHQVLRHRVITTFNAQAAGMTSDKIIDQLIAHVQTSEKLDV